MGGGGGGVVGAFRNNFALYIELELINVIKINVQRPVLNEGFLSIIQMGLVSHLCFINLQYNSGF